MLNEVFQLQTVTRVLEEDVQLAEALGFSEISALDDADRKWRACLQAKARAMLEDQNLTPAISLHRRKIVGPVELDSVELTFEPPKRSPAWEEPVRLRLHFARWIEDELHHAFVPVLGLHIFATRPGLLAERVEQHARLVLVGRDKQLTLKGLARLARVQALQLSGLEVTANRKTPKQVAMLGADTEEKKSVMEKLAEELPPLIARTENRGEDAAKSTSVGASKVPQGTFEMDKELRELAELLAGPRRRSVLLVGPPAIGKTALVRELARRRSEFGFGQTPFWSTSGARLMGGPIGFGMWQERCQQMCREVAKANAILHLNSLAELLEVGKASRGEQSIGSFLRPWIARGEMLTIAECAEEQLAAIERNEPHLAEAFHKLTITERTPEQTQMILERVFASAPGKESAEPATTKAALDRLHQLHIRYATYSARPGRPIRFLKNQLADKFPRKSITEQEVITAFSRETGLPKVLLDDDLPLDIESTRDWFGKRVIGQPEATDQVVDLLVMIKARMARPKKPLGSFLFIGPTGTGKTEMAKSLAAFLFGDAGRLVRFDLNEFSDPVSVQRLIGGPAAREAEGLLTARGREQPFSVVLLDEFEKADPSFFDLLLQVLGDGRLTDAAGRVADFCNSVIVMTSNLGAEGFRRGPAGFRAEETSGRETRIHFTEAVRKFLRPEIFNRLDAIVPFQPLTREIVLAIAQKHIDAIHQRDGIRLRPVEWQIEPEVGPHLAERGYDARYGARPLKRAIERELLVPLAEALNAYQKETPLTVKITASNGAIQIQVRARKEEQKKGQSELVSLAGWAADEEKEPKRNPEERVARLIIAERRLIGRLQRSRAAGKVEDEVSILESLERRMTALNWKSRAMEGRLAPLPKLRECLKAVGALVERAQHLETEALGAFYRKEPLEPALLKPELDGLEQDRTRLMRQLFRLQQDQPDDVVLAFYSEEREMLFEFAAAYHSAMADLGKVVGLDYFVTPPSARSKLTKLVRETPKKVELFFQSPPEKVIAIAIHAHGDLFFARFEGEAGLHVAKEGKKKERTCLIETARLPFENYEPPAGIERQGAIKARNAPACRTFDSDKDVLTDKVLGERPWGKVGLRWAAAQLTEERLKVAIEKATL